MAGVVFSIGATLALCLIDLSTNLWQVRLQMLPLGIAFGIVFIPIQTASFANISPVLTGRATAAYNAVRQVASACGTALLATILSARLTRHDAVFVTPATRAAARAAAIFSV